TTNQEGTYYYNSHGDVVKIKGPSGNVLNMYEYDIWGNLIADKVKETMMNPFAYAGEMYDKESGFYYLRARYYDPKMGRFVSEDTYKGQVDNPLSLNRYTYVYNNPLRYFDPTGHITVEEGWESFKKGWNTFTNPKSYEPAINALTNPKSYEPLVRELSGPENYDTLTDAQLNGDDFKAIGLGLLEISLGRLKIFKQASKLADTGVLDPKSIRFTQNNIKGEFKSGGNVYDVIEGLKSGKINPNDIPAIEIFELDGKIYTLDNRRLFVFQQAGINIRYVKAPLEKVMSQSSWKFTTINDGASIKVRIGGSKK
ncbi:RHS repeat-associated core domain-containing protein, partial [Brevibacillus agri]|nr:RHS repeat-associated core domain-containing protein [Brevibacillus agri]